MTDEETSRAPAGEVPVLTILWHPDVRRIGEAVALPELLSGGDVLLSRLEPYFGPPGAEKEDRRPLNDPQVSRSPLRLSGGDGGSVVVDCDETRTAVEVGGTSVSSKWELWPDDLERGVDLVLADRVALILRLQGPSQEVPESDDEALFDERPEAIGPLFLRFLREALAEMSPAGAMRPGKPWVAAELVGRLARHDWPGGAKDLRVFVRALVEDDPDASVLDLEPRVEDLLYDVPLLQGSS